MEYKPRHAQPFTIEQAALLEIPVITTEIARLQNSLDHLRDTQQQLHETVQAEEYSDPIILHALDENKMVIASQEERISMLRLALELKGLAPRSNTPPERNTMSPAEETGHRIDSAAESGGVFL